MTVIPTWEQMEAITRGEYRDVFSILGMHHDGACWAVRVFIPNAERVTVVDSQTSRELACLKRTHDGGFFVGSMAEQPKGYRLRVLMDGHLFDCEDPYRFGKVLSDEDVERWMSGRDLLAYQRMGVHFVTWDGVAGATFAVWAPQAFRVSVVGEFNGWDGRRHVMRLRHEGGIWEMFIPGIVPGDLYKFEVKDRHGINMPLKADPFGFAAEHPPQTASVACNPPVWSDVADWTETRRRLNAKDQPISIYEVHLGSWRRMPEAENRRLTYRELADQLVPYAAEMGFTHLELLPVSEFPYDGSWGYQPVGLFAPTSRHGSPEDFQYFVSAAHKAGLGVLVDWVPGHFPKDAHGLARFDGTHLYEHADPRQGYHPHWHTLIYNYGRPEVVNFLLSNVMFWIDRYHLDGLRVDAVASMLYLDYGREDGEWIPNRFGERGNLEAMRFLRMVNQALAEQGDGAVAFAEESSAWPGVSRPTAEGGLGFAYKWNMGWMNDTLHYMGLDPIHRKFHHHAMTFGLVYAFSENFVLPLSHDEVVHGKGSLLGRMPGDRWQKFANLRTYFGFMWTHPGKKLLFMGGEFGQAREWNFAASLDWHLLEGADHAGLRKLVKDLNHTYRKWPALHVYDCDPRGFQWSSPDDAEYSVYSFLRMGREGDAPMLVICNFTPVARLDYRIGVPSGGNFALVLNTDDQAYGGRGMAQRQKISAIAEPHGNFSHQVRLDLPPLACMLLTWERDG